MVAGSFTQPFLLRDLQHFERRSMSQLKQVIRANTSGSLSANHPIIGF
jgi:hypothetical protein